MTVLGVVALFGIAIVIVGIAAIVDAWQVRRDNPLFFDDPAHEYADWCVRPGCSHPTYHDGLCKRHHDYAMALVEEFLGEEEAA